MRGALLQRAACRPHEERHPGYDRHRVNAAGTTLLIVTYDSHIAARADRVVFMIDGSVADDLSLRSHQPFSAAAAGTARVDAITDRLRHLGI